VGELSRVIMWCTQMGVIFGVTLVNQMG
jgi:hypothetical protein